MLQNSNIAANPHISQLSHRLRTNMASRRYDVYDDTGRNSRGTRARNSRSARDVARRRTTRHRNDGWLSLFEEFDRDMATFHDSFFPMMFGNDNDGGGNAREYNRRVNASSNGGTFMYESHTSTMGPDGRVTTETIRSRPGRNGRPETQRIHRDATGRETRTTTNEMPPNPFDGFGWPFTSHLPAPAPVEIREITDEDDARIARSHSSRRNREPRVVVEEPDDDYEARPRRSSSHHRTSQRKSFFERARDNFRRDGRI